jgi:hypothetical protein
MLGQRLLPADWFRRDRFSKIEYFLWETKGDVFGRASFSFFPVVLLGVWFTELQ